MQDERRSEELRQISERVIRLETIVEQMDKDVREHKTNTDRQFEKLYDKFEKVDNKIDKLQDKLVLQLDSMSKQIVDNKINIGKIFAIASFCAVIATVAAKVAF